MCSSSRCSPRRGLCKEPWLNFEAFLLHSWRTKCRPFSLCISRASSCCVFPGQKHRYMLNLTKILSPFCCCCSGARSFCVFLVSEEQAHTEPDKNIEIQGWARVPGRYLITTMHQCSTYPDAPPPLPHFNVGNGSGSASSRRFKNDHSRKNRLPKRLRTNLERGGAGGGSKSHSVWDGRY